MNKNILLAIILTVSIAACQNKPNFYEGKEIQIRAHITDTLREGDFIIINDLLIKHKAFAPYWDPELPIFIEDDRNPYVKDSLAAPCSMNYAYPSNEVGTKRKYRTENPFTILRHVSRSIIEKHPQKGFKIKDPIRSSISGIYTISRKDNKKISLQTSSNYPFEITIVKK